MSELFKTACKLWMEGYVPLPIRTDGSKAPAVKWAQYNDGASVTLDDLATWFERGTTEGIGVLTGHASGELEMLEFEGLAVDEGFLEMFEDALLDSGLLDLWTQIEQGWTEESPSGGLHYHWRVSDGPALRNLKLASRPATAEELAENPGDRVKGLVETRGNGGFTVICPSGGRTHESGKPWVLRFGGPSTVVSITAEQRDLITGVANSLDLMPRVAESYHSDSGGGGGIRLPHEGTPPGEDWANQHEYSDILTDDGWTLHHQDSRCSYWTRPGKHPRLGSSATLWPDGGLYVFSTSTGLPDHEPISKFGYYAFTQHDGDFKAAASALRKAGYGQAAKATNPAPSRPAPSPAPVADSGQSDDPPPPPSGRPRGTLDPNGYDPNEDAMATMLVDSTADVLYCSTTKSWLAWNGHRWLPEDALEQVKGHIRVLARTLPDNPPPWNRFHTRVKSAAGVKGIEFLARSDPRARVSMNDFDRLPYELNTPSSIIDLNTGRAIPQAREHMHMQCTTVDPTVPEAAPNWLKFVNETYLGDLEVIDFIQRLAGYCLIGEVREQLFVISVGEGGNGKGVFIDMIAGAMGSYAGVAARKLVTKRTNDAHTTDLTELKGKRLMILDEVSRGDQLDEGMLKALTGGGDITARKMAKDNMTFTPTYQLWQPVNQALLLPGIERALRRRMLVIQYDNEPQVLDMNLRTNLKREWPGILAWLIQGAQMYLREGLEERPDAVVRATEALFLDNDHFGMFIADECEMTNLPAGMGTSVAVMHKEYLKWAFEERLPANLILGKKNFSVQMRQRFNIVPDKKYRGVHRYPGITLTHFRHGDIGPANAFGGSE